jgi:mRNA interferase MazF
MPQAGREIDKRRPALVLSPRVYNSKAEVCMVCPLTSKAKGFEVAVPTGAVLADQVKSLSWRRRRAGVISKAPPAVTADVRAMLKALLGIS